MSQTRHNQAHPRDEHGTLASYVFGFVSSVVLTLAAYVAVTNQLLSGEFVRILIVVFALTQFIVQVVFFLHLGHETKPRWKLLVFCGMLLVVGILVGGSLWIMGNLNYHMTPTQVQNYMNSQDGF